MKVSYDLGEGFNPFFISSIFSLISSSFDLNFLDVSIYSLVPIGDLALKLIESFLILYFLFADDKNPVAFLKFYVAIKFF
jgi:hypothetical protein